MKPEQQSTTDLAVYMNDAPPLEFWVALKFPHSGHVQEHVFASATARAAFIVGLSPFTSVQREWEV